jgi:hypothetical protein
MKISEWTSRRPFGCSKGPMPPFYLANDLFALSHQQPSIAAFL